MLQTEAPFVYQSSQSCEKLETLNISLLDEGSKQGKLSDFNVTPDELSLRECLLLTVTLFTVGVLAYSCIFEHWTLLDSLYFTMTLLTTVGYGDMIPTNKWGKLFTSIFALFGVVILGLALGVVGSRLIEAEIKYADKMREKSAKAIEQVFTTNHQHQRREETISSSDSFPEPLMTSLHLESSSTLANNADGSSSYQKRTDKEELAWFKIGSGHMQLMHFIQNYLPGITSMLIGALIIAFIENWGWVDTIYYCVVTSTTVGFGDLTPKQPLSKIFGIVLVPLSVGSCGYMLGNFASAIVENKREKFYNKLLLHDLTLEDLDILDTDGDGEVNELEYIRFMLVAMKKVDSQLFEDLHQQFLHLDQSGDGKITMIDLKMMAEKKMKKASEKIMSEY